MVAPVNNFHNVNSLLRPQQAPSVSQPANRNVAQEAVPNKTPSVGKTDLTITLASANSPPPSNLPRGSIVDKLV